MKNWNIEVSQSMYEKLSKMFSFLELDAPRHITSKEIEKVLTRINRAVNITRNDFQETTHNIWDQVKTRNPNREDYFKINNILVISKKELTRFQLKSVFSTCDINVTALENQYIGLAEYIKRLHDLIIFDSDGDIDQFYEIIREIECVSAKNRVHKKIIVLLPAGYKPKNKIIFNRGIDQFILKNDNWIDNLLNYLNLSKECFVLF